MYVKTVKQKTEQIKTKQKSFRLDDDDVNKA